MTEIVIKIYHYFRNHRPVFWCTMIFLFAFFGFFASRIQLEEDLNKLMPSSRNPDGTTKLAFADLRIKDKTYLLFEGPKGMSPDSIAAAADAFIDSLEATDRHQPKNQRVISDVFYQIPEDIMGDAIDYMTAHFPAYIDTTVYAHMDSLLTIEHFQQQMAKNSEDMEGEFGSTYPELIQMDPMGMRNLLAERMKSLFAGSQGGFKTIDGHFFVPDGTVCIAFITPRFSATDTGQGNRLFEMLNNEIERFTKSHPNISVCYHGTPASGYYNSTTIKHDLTTAWCIHHRARIYLHLLPQLGYPATAHPARNLWHLVRTRYDVFHRGQVLAPCIGHWSSSAGRSHELCAACAHPL